ncbi:hypothetical protein CYK37_12565 [Mesorhizobium loti]|nr:hypothetical protein CYK37_12565 [Mesorhizobium loti]
MPSGARASRKWIPSVKEEAAFRSIRFSVRAFLSRAIPGKVCSGFPSGIAQKQRVRAFPRFREKRKRSSGKACACRHP